MAQAQERGFASSDVLPRWDHRGAGRPWYRACWLLAGLATVGIFGLDVWFAERVSGQLHTEHPLDRDFYTTTRPFWLACRTACAHALGIAAAYFLLIGFHSRGWRGANSALLAVLLTALLANAAQGLIGRQRPNQSGHHLTFAPLESLTYRDKECFPSGEAATAFALGCVLAHLLPQYRWAFLGAAVLAAGARLVNNAHYFSDVAAGAALGLICARALFVHAYRYHDELAARLRGS